MEGDRHKLDIVLSTPAYSPKTKSKRCSYCKKIDCTIDQFYKMRKKQENSMLNFVATSSCTDFKKMSRIKENVKTVTIDPSLESDKHVTWLQVQSKSNA